MLQRFCVIVGPTASGKSELALALARALAEAGAAPGEILSADSMQVYRGLDIGTAKPTLDERRRVPHHLIDLVEPTERFSVDRWRTLAEQCIERLRAQRRTPIVVGGTNLYVRALLDGLFEGPEADPALRAELAALDPAALRRRLERTDPDAAARIHPNDLRRTVRALEVHALAGRPISELQAQWAGAGGRPDALIVHLAWPTDALNRRINARVRAMMAAGLEGEARRLWSEGRLGPQAREALGYKQLVDAFEGRCSVDDAVERIKIETRRMAKAQRTWLRHLGARPGALTLERAEDAPPNLAQDTARVLDALAGPAASDKRPQSGSAG